MIECDNCGFEFDPNREPVTTYQDTRRCRSCGHKHGDLPDPRPDPSDVRTQREASDHADETEVELADGGEDSTAAALAAALSGDGDGVTIVGDVNIDLGDGRGADVVDVDEG